jgi:hypothetical protein
LFLILPTFAVVVDPVAVFDLWVGVMSSEEDEDVSERPFAVAAPLVVPPLPALRFVGL